MKRDPQKKIVYGLFNDSYPPVLDGVSLTVENYVRWLVNNGKEVCVTTPWNPICPRHRHYLMHRYFSLPTYNRHPYRYGYPWLDPFIWRKMSQVPFRIVHAHCPFSSGRLARYAAHKHHIPLVTTFHSKYKTDLMRSLPPYMVEYQMRRMRAFYNGADAVWIPSAGVEETVREYGIKAPVTIVDNGNDLLDIDISPGLAEYKADARRRLGIKPERLVLLFVGQHIREKGVNVIIDALGMLKGKVDFEMHFVGTGYALEEMRRQVTQLGLWDRVTFHGVINQRSHLTDIYAAGHLFLFPSFYDNAPLVVREAAAMGSPTLLLRGSTAAECINDGVNGFLTDPTAQAYADSITALDKDRHRLLEVGQAARNSLSRSWDTVMTDVMQRYKEIIDKYEFTHRNK